MPGTFAFYRPRGISRNYIVEISVDLLPSETATVSADRVRPTGYNCGSCGHQHPTHSHSTTPVQGKKTGKVEQYTIGGSGQEPIIIGDTISIEVRDNNVVPIQRIVYTASETGFTCSPLPFTINGHTWKPKEIELQKITLVDWGNERRALPEHIHEHNHTTSVFGPETVMTPPPQPAIAPKAINLQAHLTEIAVYLKQYPYLSQVQIIHAMTQHSSQEGTINIPKLTKSLRKSNEKMRKKVVEAAPSEPLPIQQARQIIESHSL